MNASDELLRQARGLGLRLEARGDKLAVIPAARCPPEFAARLRAHKSDLLTALEGRAANLPADCIPWLHIARQVLAGEFTGANRSLIGSLTIGLRGVRHPVAKKALAMLTGLETR